MKLFRQSIRTGTNEIMPSPKKIHQTQATLTPTSDHNPVIVAVDDSKRLREIRLLVKNNNKSIIDDNVIICQIYMESRFDSTATPLGSSARGLMQLLKAPIRELYRIENIKKPKAERESENKIFHEADKFHDSTDFIADAINIEKGRRTSNISLKKINDTAHPIQSLMPTKITEACEMEFITRK